MESTHPYTTKDTQRIGDTSSTYPMRKGNEGENICSECLRKDEIISALYEALKDLYIYRNAWKDVLGERLTEKLLKALAKAEGK